MVAAKKYVGSTTYYQYPVYDHRGSVVRLLDETGAVTAYYEYDAFGSALREDEDALTQAIGNRFRYQSNWMCLPDDTDKRYYISAARVYDTLTGRFLQKDPIAFPKKQTNDYQAFGEPYAANTVTTINNRYTYTGREKSGVTGLNYHRYRWDDPICERWLGRDPSGYPNNTWGNLYDYAYADPVVGYDPYGLRNTVTINNPPCDKVKISIPIKFMYTELSSRRSLNDSKKEEEIAWMKAYTLKMVEKIQAAWKAKGFKYGKCEVEIEINSQVYVKEYEIKNGEKWVKDPKDGGWNIANVIITDSSTGYVGGYGESTDSGRHKEGVPIPVDRQYDSTVNIWTGDSPTPEKGLSKETQEIKQKRQAEMELAWQHEFGHVLGLADEYEYWDGKLVPKSGTERDSIMGIGKTVFQSHINKILDNALTKCNCCKEESK